MSPPPPPRVPVYLQLACSRCSVSATTAIPLRRTGARSSQSRISIEDTTARTPQRTFREPIVHPACSGRARSSTAVNVWHVQHRSRGSRHASTAKRHSLLYIYICMYNQEMHNVLIKSSPTTAAMEELSATKYQIFIRQTKNKNSSRTVTHQSDHHTLQNSHNEKGASA